MFSVAPNIVFAPNMMQNAECKHRMQDTNTAHFQSPYFPFLPHTVSSSPASRSIKGFINNQTWVLGRRLFLYLFCICFVKKSYD